MRISTCFPARQGFLSVRRQFDKTGAPALAPTYIHTYSTQTFKWVKVVVRDDGARGGATEVEGRRYYGAPCNQTGCLSAVGLNMEMYFCMPSDCTLLSQFLVLTSVPEIMISIAKPQLQCELPTEQPPLCLLEVCSTAPIHFWRNVAYRNYSTLV